MFTFTLLGGSEGSSSKLSLLVFESAVSGQKVKVLADPGWDGVSDLKYLESIIDSIDLILLSHPTVEYIGALPLLWSKFPLVMKKIPVYTTLPISQLGKNSLVELYKSLGFIGPYNTNLFELKDLDEFLNEFNLLKHGQSISLPKFSNMKIYCYNAGHSLGGSFWSILMNNGNEKVIYAPTWNHSKDSFLNGSAMLEYGSTPLPQLLRPTTIITSSDLGSSMTYKQRVLEFYQLIDNTIQRGGTVVLPTSVSGRLLELIHLVDEHLQHQPIPVILMSSSGTKNLTLAGNLLEWMSPQVIKSWEFKNQIPFDLSRVEFIDDVNEVIQRTGSKVIFVSDNDITPGTYSNDLLNRLSNDDKTTIILTEKSDIGSVGDQLYQCWEQLCSLNNSGRIQDGFPVGLQETIEFTNVREEQLVGEELEEFTERISQRRKEKEAQLKMEEENKKLITNKLKALEEDDDDDDDDLDDSGVSDTEIDPEALTRNQDLQQTQQLQQQTQSKEEEIRIDYDLRVVTRNRNKMFPYVNAKVKMDDYGEVINAKDFIKEDDSQLFKKRIRSMDDDDYDDNDHQWNLSKKIKKERKKSKQEEEEERINHNLDPLNHPRKMNKVPFKHNTRCALSYIDLSGTVDLRSYLLILNQLKPKKIVVYNSFKSSSKVHNIELIKSKLSEDLLIVAKQDAEIQIDNLTTNIDIKLDETLESQLHWQKLNDGYTLSHVNGELEKIDDKYVLKPLSSSSKILTTNTLNEISIGDLKLSEIRMKLRSMNFDVMFKGEGILSVNNDLCLIRRLNDDGDLVIDGSPNEVFYIVRDLINDMLAHV